MTISNHCDTVVDIPNLGKRVVHPTARYDYDNNKTKCPVCLGIGWVWAGWFSCDSKCGAVALVETGEVFMKSLRSVKEQGNG